MRNGDFLAKGWQLKLDPSRTCKYPRIEKLLVSRASPAQIGQEQMSPQEMFD
jgi:hypothetical protein